MMQGVDTRSGTARAEAVIDLAAVRHNVVVLRAAS
jgi:hypothetical protein